jgi:hypothetical protein
MTRVDFARPSPWTPQALSPNDAVHRATDAAGGLDTQITLTDVTDTSVRVHLTWR